MIDDHFPSTHTSIPDRVKRPGLGCGLKYGEKVFLIVGMIAIIGTCVTLLLMCGG